MIEQIKNNLSELHLFADLTRYSNSWNARSNKFTDLTVSVYNTNIQV